MTSRPTSPSPPSPAGAGNILVLARGSVPAAVTTWADLPAVDLPRVAAVLTDDAERAAAAVWSHVRRGGELLLAARSRADDTTLAELRAEGFAVVTDDDVLPATGPRDAQDGRLWLLTSGSTGRPKRVAHTREGLTTVTAEQPPRRWLCAYAVGAYAWWQVVTLSLAHAGQDVVFVGQRDLDVWPRLAREHGVDAVSGTPTFWRQAMFRSQEDVAALPLRQVTLGGEPVDQQVLDRLRELFPTARITWIYASSEAGAAVAVHDGLAGFPRAWLDRDVPGRPRLSVDGDELVLTSPHGAAGMTGPLRTGDRVEVVDGRVLITGRLRSDEINVGGSKASASAVRAALLAHPAVAWAAARGRRAPIVGTVVVADVVLDSPVTVEELSRWCAQRLPDHAVPRRIAVLDAIPMRDSLKSEV